MGETYDARLALHGLGHAGLRRRRSWEPVVVGARGQPAGPGASRPAGAAFAGVQGPKSITEPKPGVYVLDLGQNFAGVPRLKVHGRARPEDHAPFRRAAQPRRHDLHDQPPQARASTPTSARARARRSGSPGSPSTASSTSRSPASSRRPTADTVTGIALSSDTPVVGRVRVLRPDAQPAPQQHLLDPAGQLHRHPHRLPPARRAAGLDGRRPGLHPHGHAQLRRPGVLHQVAGRPGRRPARRRPVPDGRPGEGRRRRRRTRLGRRRRDLPLDDLPGLRRPPAARAAVSLDGQVRRVLPQAQHARAAAAGEVPLLRRLAEHRRRHAQGRHLHGLLRPSAPGSRPRPPRCWARPTTPREYRRAVRADQGRLQQGLCRRRRPDQGEHPGRLRAGPGGRPGRRRAGEAGRRATSSRTSRSAAGISRPASSAPRT